MIIEGLSYIEVMII